MCRVENEEFRDERERLAGPQRQRLCDRVAEGSRPARHAREQARHRGLYELRVVAKTATGRTITDGGPIQIDSKTADDLTRKGGTQ